MSNSGWRGPLEASGLIPLSEQGHLIQVAWGRGQLSSNTCKAENCTASVGPPVRVSDHVCGDQRSALLQLA